MNRDAGGVPVVTLRMGWLVLAAALLLSCPQARASTLGEEAASGAAAGMLDGLERASAPGGGSPRAAGPAAPTTSYVGGDPATWVGFDQDMVCEENGNACGTTCLAMVLANEGLIGRSLDAARTLDRDVRPWPGFSASRDLMRYAERKGLRARARNGSSVDELEERLHDGNRVMLMIDGGGVPHWTVVLGVERDLATGERTFVMADPGDQLSPLPGRTFTFKLTRLSQQKLEDQWRAPMRGAGQFIADTCAYRNYLICFSRDEANLPTSRTWWVSAAEQAADGASDVGNGVTRMVHGHVLRGAGDVVAGSLRLCSSVRGLARQAVVGGGRRVAKPSPR